MYAKTTIDQCFVCNSVRKAVKVVIKADNSNIIPENFCNENTI